MKTGLCGRFLHFLPLHRITGVDIDKIAVLCILEDRKINKNKHMSETITPKYELAQDQIASSNKANEEYNKFIDESGEHPDTGVQSRDKDAAIDLMVEARERAESILGEKQDWGTAVKVDRMYKEAYDDNERFDRVNEAKRALSEQLHENWRKDIEAGFIADEKSADTARLRPSKDKTGQEDATWFADKEANGIVFETDENGSKLVNTNVAFSELPPSWQKANSGAANFVVDTVASSLESGEDMTSNEAIEKSASAVHENWMKDNAWQRESTPDLFVPYDQLIESEKKKDRDQVLLAVEHMLIEQ